MTAVEPGARGPTGVRAEAPLLRRLFDHLPALVAFWDRDLRNVTANRAYVDWFGISPDAMKGAHIRTVLGEEVYAKNLPFILGALGGEEQLFERTLVDPQGRVRHSQASYVPEIVAGEVIGFFVLVTDITPRVEAQRELDAAQELAQVGSWVYYPHGREMSWSRQMFRLAGMDPDTDEATLEAYLALVHPDDAPMVRAIAEQLTRLDSPYDLHYRLLLPDGTVRHVHSRGRPEHADDGSVTRLTGTIQDETDLRLAAEELASANEQLTSANRVLADMIGMLGHDVRQPIQSVVGYLELAADHWDVAPRDQVLAQVLRAEAAARRMNTLVDDVLMLVNVDTGVLSTRPVPVELGALTAEVVTTSSGATPVEVEIVRDSVVRADPFHVRQVLANLVSNAARYGEPPITVTVDRVDDAAVVRVVDHGQGVPEEFVPRLFDRFSRASSGVAATKPGSGFGLYIVRELLSANDGRVDYVPVEGGGSCFAVTLPLATG